MKSTSSLNKLPAPSSQSSSAEVSSKEFQKLEKYVLAQAKLLQNQSATVEQLRRKIANLEAVVAQFRVELKRR